MVHTQAGIKTLASGIFAVLFGYAPDQAHYYKSHTRHLLKHLLSNLSLPEKDNFDLELQI